MAKRRRNPYGKLPEVKERADEMYPHPELAGDYLLEGDTTISPVGTWDGRDWYRPDGTKMLRAKDITGCWGPIPGTQRPTQQQQEDQGREWCLMDAFSSPVHLVRQLWEHDDAAEDVKATLRRLAKEGKLRVVVTTLGSEGPEQWDTGEL